MVSPLTNSPLLQSARNIAQTLRDAGHTAYLAGGCVRDLLLDLTPTDFDVATSATPEQITALCPRTFQVGAHFGVILVLDDAGATEVATFRNDGTYLDGRRPEAVRFSTDPREDVVRRDFTINGMLLDPFEVDPEEAILDFVGGRDDLAHRLIRTIGAPEQRFAEDKLRMLRAVRFAARLDFDIYGSTAAAIRQHAHDITQVSQERIRDELTRMLTEGNAHRSFEFLHNLHLLREILPEVEALRGVQQPPEYHPEGDVWVHTMMLLEHLPAGCSATLAWGMLLHDIGKPATFQPARSGDRIRFSGHVEVGMRIAEVILGRLRFSNEETAQIISLIHHHMQFGDVMQMKRSTLKRFLRLPQFEEHLALHRADCMSAHGDLRLYDFAKAAYENEEPAETRPPWLVTGRDLIAAGYRPSPQFKRMLLAAEDAQLEGLISSTEEGLALVEREFGPAPLPPD
jgi:poly(A) polymerase